MTTTENKTITMVRDELRGLHSLHERLAREGHRQSVLLDLYKRSTSAILADVEAVIGEEEDVPF